MANIPIYTTMDIYCHVRSETDQVLTDLVSSCEHYKYHSFDTLSSLIENFRSHQHEGICIIEWEKSEKKVREALQTLKDLSGDYTCYIFLLGQTDHTEQLTQALEYGAHDYLLFPLDKKLLKCKVQIASQIVNDRQALLDSSAVLERYATHVDQIAAERAHQLFHAERLSTLGTMSAGIAHEIKTPLGYMATSLETAKIYWEKTGPLLEAPDKIQAEDHELVERVLSRIPRALERIDSGLYKINRIMKSLQSFARASKGEKREVNVNECIDMALEVCEGVLRGRVEVRKDYCPELPVLFLDPVQLEQVVTNLVVNACHAMEETDAPCIRITTDFCEDNIRITIEDNGPGIPEDKWESIWQPFYTTKEEGKGTGLGLAICKGLMKDNGGRLSLEKGTLSGACFTMTFPRRSH